MHAEENSPGWTLQRTGELSAPVQPGNGSVTAVDTEVFRFLQQTLDAGVLSRIYGEFLERTRRRICELATLDHAGVREFAHTVAGTAGMLGATALAACAGTAGTMEAGSGKLHQLTRGLAAECERLETELRRRRVAL